MTAKEFANKYYAKATQKKLTPDLWLQLMTAYAKYQAKIASRNTRYKAIELAMEEVSEFDGADGYRELKNSIDSAIMNIQWKDVKPEEL